MALRSIIGAFCGLVASFLASAALHAAEPAASPTDRITDLSGTWRFKLDPNKEGLTHDWFTTKLPDQIKLPGTTDEAHLGIPNTKPASLDGLYRTNVYAGPAWYQRDIDIPVEWQNKHVTLFLERVHWVTCAWIDGQPAGTADSLVAPHLHDLGTLTPGKHQLTLCVDNTLQFDLGAFVSIYYEGTQTNWNGIIGRIELQANDRISIAQVQVYPDADGKRVRVQVRVSNPGDAKCNGLIQLSITDRASGAVVTPAIEEKFSGTVPAVVGATLDLGPTAKLWDEFSRNLYDLHVSLATQGAVVAADGRTVSFGLRELDRKGTQFTMNGRPLFLRGTLECAIFPKTGYPSTDVAAWQRIYRIEKSYGLNFIRFHSWCPPEAAFEAADIEGIMIQAEGPQANVNVGHNAGRDAFVEQELERMVDTYGNHPSFCLMTLGNEYGGKDAILSQWVDMLIKRDSRHLYSSASSAQTTANRQFTEGSPRGIHGPRTDLDFHAANQKQDRPMTGHEIGQWTFFPNFDEIKKYDGVLEARNFEIVRDDLKAKGMLDLAPQFFQATGRQAVLLYKEEIEVLLRTRDFAGFSLLDLHDYPGQGTALIGLLDPFWDSKGLVPPETHHQYCGPTVPLLRLAKRTFTTDEPLDGAIDIAHFGPTALVNAVPQWTIKTEAGQVIASGALAAADVPTGKLTSLGVIHAALATPSAPCKAIIIVSLQGAPYTNQWDIWIYPQSVVPTPPADVVAAHAWDENVETTLAAGKKVFLQIGGGLPHAHRGSFLPVFWSPVWFHSDPGTMGILCDPKHPALAQFPTEFYSNWQWWDLIQGSRSLILTDTPPDFRPIVQVIDNFSRNEKLGNLLEARVGKGRLLVSTLNLGDHLDTRPAARQMLASLYAYVASDRFQPTQELTVESLRTLLSGHHGSNMVKLGAKVIDADSQDPANPAAGAIDGQDDTFWHTRWEPQADPMPHHITIDLGRQVALTGITYLPRQDMSNGRLRQFEIYCSDDGREWGSPAATSHGRDNVGLQTISFKQTVHARYIKLVAQSEIHGNGFAAVAELDIVPAK
jgi:hypothetical protein